MCLTCGCSRGPEDQSRTEQVKAASRHLRGDLAQELAAGTATFGDDAVQVLKFHGVYQQDDRDRRRQARLEGGGKHHMMMVRTRIPGGVVPPAAYLAHDDIAQRLGNGSLRVTTRQDFQLHGVLKGDLREAVRAINDALLTTLGGCGDQVRNVMFCPAPRHDRLRTDVAEVLARIVAAVTPRTRAYHEIWVDGVDHTPPAAEHEPLYGEQYLPRKFKIGLALEDDNCIDVFANDLALVATRDGDGALHGFTVAAGGGLGRTNNRPDTFAAVAVPLGWVPADAVVDVCLAVVAAQRDHGDRRDRRHARLKYLLAARGVDWLRSEVERRAGLRLRPVPAAPAAPVLDHLGWHEQGDGRLWLGVHVENGRIADTGDQRLRTGLRRVVERFGIEVRLTAQQNVILAGVAPGDRGAVDAVLRGHGVAPVELVPLAVRTAMACPALPTCGLAVAESERVMPALARRLDGLLAELGLEDEPVGWRMTGCPNGCARPYLGDAGFVGVTLGKYDVFLGGDAAGTRLNRLYARSVPLDEIPAVLRDPLAAYRDERLPGEGFGDWCHRTGVERLQKRFGVDAAPERRVTLRGAAVDEREAVATA